MLKRTIKYTDYDGNEREETFYFNLNKAELAEWELTTEGGLQAFIQRMIETKDQKKLIIMFKEIILKSYGEKSDDGKHFVKSPELREAFSQTEAYSELFMELAEDTDKLVAFFNGVIPKIPTLPEKRN